MMSNALSAVQVLMHPSACSAQLALMLMLVLRALLVYRVAKMCQLPTGQAHVQLYVCRCPHSHPEQFLLSHEGPVCMKVWSLDVDATEQQVAVGGVSPQLQLYRIPSGDETGGASIAGKQVRRALPPAERSLVDCPEHQRSKQSSSVRRASHAPGTLVASCSLQAYILC